MDAELVAGFAAVIASLLAIALLVIASRKIVEKMHQQSQAAPRGAGPDSKEKGSCGDAR